MTVFQMSQGQAANLPERCWKNIVHSTTVVDCGVNGKLAEAEVQRYKHRKTKLIHHNVPQKVNFSTLSPELVQLKTMHGGVHYCLKEQFARIEVKRIRKVQKSSKKGSNFLNLFDKNTQHISILQISFISTEVMQWRLIILCVSIQPLWLMDGVSLDNTVPSIGLY